MYYGLEFEKWTERLRQQADERAKQEYLKGLPKYPENFGPVADNEEKTTSETEIERDEVMDARKWIEFGKMYSAMRAEEWNIELYNTDDRTWVEVSVPDGKEYYHSEACANPYLAIKEVYFNYYLGLENCEEISLDIETNTRKFLETQADKNGTTVDEEIMKVLQSALEKIRA